jgi:lysozyme
MRLKGIDLSRYNTARSWTPYLSSGLSFAFIKATEGTNILSPVFLDQWVNIGQGPALRGAYHFFKPMVDARKQAEHFIRLVKPVTRPGDLPPVLDVEDPRSGRISANAYADRIEVWLKLVEQAFGQKPIIYTGSFFWRDNLGNTNRFSAHPTWLARYGRNMPTQLPGRQGLDFWQFTDKGAEAGFSPVDTNWYFGTLEELWAMGGQKNLVKSNVFWDKVVGMQKMLTLRGYNTQGIDGRFGQNTDTAVRAFQRDQNLVVDGEVGPKTWRKLFRLQEFN